MTTVLPVHDPYAALRFREFRLLLTARFLATFSLMIIETVLGWHLYEKTGSKFALGLLGLFEILPVLLFALYAGKLADTYNRHRIAMIAQAGFVLSAAVLTFCTYIDASVYLIYASVLALGIARAFNFPAAGTLLVRTVPSTIYSNAAAWSSNIWQTAATIGPACGGFIIALTHSAAAAYAVATLLLAIAVLCLSSIKLLPETSKKKVSPGGIREGFLFLAKNHLLLSVISLDLFAVFLGGAVALLPVYAKDILHVGPDGLGWLRAAPAIGAVMTSMILAHRPPLRRAGATLLWAVAGFGAATIVFGLSTSPWLSFAMLFLTGVFDNVSVIIRSTMMLVSVPDEMRGRVSAINSIFLGSSNELGAFESGAVASVCGTVPSVVLGGIGTIAVVIFTALKFPQLRKLGRIHSIEADSEV